MYHKNTVWAPGSFIVIATGLVTVQWAKLGLSVGVPSEYVQLKLRLQSFDVIYLFKDFIYYLTEGERAQAGGEAGRGKERSSFHPEQGA